MGGKIVLVTGGSGFLGQHVVKHLQLYGEGIDEIRILDITPFEQRLEYTVSKSVNTIVGSLMDAAILNKSMNNVDAVFHLASVIDVSLFPDNKTMHQINVNGTENIIKACKDNNVRYLIYCGSLGSFYGYDPVRDGTETSVSVPRQCAHGSYGVTKYLALQRVLKENGTKLYNGDTLYTVGILPSGMYGELDPTNKIRRNRSVRNGVYYRMMGPMEAKIQFAYAGNVAYMFIKAYQTLAKSAEVGGQYFFAVDDSPAQSHIEHRRPYMNQTVTPSTWFISERIVIFILKLLYIFLLFVRIFRNANFPLSPYVIYFVNTTFYVKYDKAKTMLGYQPLYDYKTAIQNAIASIK